MYYESDLHVAMNGTQLQWVGGVDIYKDETKADLIIRFVYETKPYDYIDPITNKRISDMTEDELNNYKEQLKQEQLINKEHAKFLADYEDAISKGLY